MQNGTDCLGNKGNILENGIGAHIEQNTHHDDYHEQNGFKPGLGRDHQNHKRNRNRNRDDPGDFQGNGALHVGHLDHLAAHGSFRAGQFLQFTQHILGFDFFVNGHMVEGHTVFVEALDNFLVEQIERGSQINLIIKPQNLFNVRKGSKFFLDSQRLGNRQIRYTDLGVGDILVILGRHGLNGNRGCGLFGHIGEEIEVGFDLGGIIAADN